MLIFLAARVYKSYVFNKSGLQQAHLFDRDLVLFFGAVSNLLFRLQIATISRSAHLATAQPSGLQVSGPAQILPP